MSPSPSGGALPPPLQARLEASLQSASSRGGRKVAVFDADGTLWADDVGERHLRVLSATRSPGASAGAPTPFEAYRRTCAEDLDRGYRLGCQLLAGLTEEQVFVSCRRAWAEHRHLLFSYVGHAFEWLRANDVEIWVVSASDRWIIEIALGEFGLGAERIIAGAVRLSEGRLTRQIEEPFPNGQGKVARIHAHIGVQPMLAFGNSAHDFPMLADARDAILVLDPTKPSSELREQAASRGWLALEPTTIAS